MNYLIYPTKVMKLSQSYTMGNHKQHTTGKYRDYPIDETCGTGGRAWFYCPCDEMKIKKIGITKYASVIYLESTEPVNFANGDVGYVTMLMYHCEPADLRKLKVGQVFYRKQKIIQDGRYGNATGNHFHISVGKGRFPNGGTGSLTANGVTVINTTQGSMKPEKAFFVEKGFTTIKDSKGLKFKTCPSSTSVSKESEKTASQIESDNLNEQLDSVVAFLCKHYGYTSESKEILDFEADFNSANNSLKRQYIAAYKDLQANDKKVAEAKKKEQSAKAPTRKGATVSKYLGSYEVVNSYVNVRKDATTASAKVTFSQFTKDKQKQILKLNKSKQANYFVKGVKFRTTKEKTANGLKWGKTDSGWVALKYCKKI